MDLILDKKGKKDKRQRKTSYSVFFFCQKQQ